MQAKVICLEADFSKVELNKHVVDGHIEVIPDDEEEEELGDTKSEPTNLAAKP